jgi:cytochrome c
VNWHTRWIVPAALLLLGCGPPAENAPGAAGGAGAAAAGAGPLDFDVGEIKTAEEYLAEPRYAQADLERGELLSLTCRACHTWSAGEAPLMGPNLHGLFGRRSGSAPGFEYSPALRTADIIWTPQALDAWLSDPSGFMPGNNMPFAGLHSASDRRDLLAFLLTATR